MSLRFRTDHDPAYGQVVPVSPLVRRVTAENPGKFTGWGTGTYLIGRGEVAIVDPGPDDPAHVQALLDAVAGEEVTHLFITHTHRDHSPAARALRRATGAPIVAFGPHPLPPDAQDAETEEADGAARAGGGDGAEEEPGDLELVPDIELVHGDVVATGSWTIEALHTPGHISNHLCFALREEAALFSGDHVMGWSTTVIPPPDGHMGDYLRSLALLVPRDDRRYYPTHGAPIEQPHDYVQALIAHRRAREAQILDQLAGGPRTIAEIVAVIYADVRPELHEPAARSVLAHLVGLHADGRVEAVEADTPTASGTYRLATRG